MLISSDVWVAALIRRVQMAGAFATVVRRGDARAGAVLIKTADHRGGRFRLFAAAERGRDERVWMQPSAGATEAEIDAHIARATRIDPDIWVVEIEDRDGRRFLTEPVEGD
ncbi:MAG: DUF1491 family protein [Caulobacteraceae bacterium]